MWQEKKRWEPAHLTGAEEWFAKKGSAGFPLGRMLFPPCFGVCSSATGRHLERRRAGQDTALVTPLVETRSE